MEIRREIYWNVSQISIRLMYVLAFVSIGTFIYGFYKRIRVYLQGRHLNRIDNFPKRLIFFIKNTLLQLKVLKVLTPGIFHACLFWSFLTLFAGTLLVMVEVDFTKPFFNWTFLKGTFYKIFSLSLDLAGFVVLISLVYFFIRRFFLKPEGLNTTYQDYLIHALLFAIIITGFTIEGLRICLTELKTNPEVAYYSPVGFVIALSLNGLSQTTFLNLHVFFWWLHLILALVFIALIPFIKLRHLFLIPSNYFFTDLRPRGTMDSLNLEDEKIQTFGVETIKDYYWKDIFDSDACISCKRCQDRCPAYLTEKPLSPMKFINQIQESAFYAPETNLINAITPEAIWSCTTCFTCQEICPAGIEHVNKILDIRRNLVLMKSKFPQEINTVFKGLENQGNPWGIGAHTRGDWAKDLGIKKLSESKDVEYLYFVGCSGSFDDRNKKVATSFAKILQKAGVSFGILGEEETCCGDSARRIGNEYLYQALVQQNIETMKNYNVKKIITTCPHCYNIIKKEYPQFGGNFEVYHHTEIILKLIESGKIELKEMEKKITLHDSCYLGRYNEIYEQPRKILKNIQKLKLLEMEKNKDRSFCCGAGGGRMWMEEHLGKRINFERTEQVMKVNPEILVTCCPFCMTMFDEGIKQKNQEENIKLLDIVEVVESLV